MCCFFVCDGGYCYRKTFHAGSVRMHRIEIDELRTRVHIGVTERERRRRQCIAVSLIIVPETAYDEIEDNVARTVNYSSVRREVLDLLEKGSFRLIETVARTIAERLLGLYAMTKLEVTVKKYPYRDTGSVSYTLEV